MILGRDHVRPEALSGLTCAAALGVLGLAALLADRHPPADQRVFSALNHHEREPAFLRVFQQLGTPWVLPATAALAALTARRRLAVTAALALPVEKAAEVGLKKLRPTPRPLYVEPTVLRDDAPVEGESFPSGHAAIAWTAVTITAPHVPPAAVGALAACAVVSSTVRVSQGAHHPVDAVGGAALGVAIGTGLTHVVGRWTTRGS
jgi:membrane-associated phospholipid phosphatase